MTLQPGAVPRSGQASALRICLDANVWVASFIAHKTEAVHPRSAAIKIVRAIFDMHVGGLSLQLVASHELIDTVTRVIIRLGHSQSAAEEFGASIIGLIEAGPLQLDPTLLVAGRDQLAMHDREDARVLAACFASQAALLVTDNLVDFETKDSERIDTQRVSYRNGGTRQLFALIHRRSNGGALVVMHPIDAANWLVNGRSPEPEDIKQHYR